MFYSRVLWGFFEIENYFENYDEYIMKSYNLEQGTSGIWKTVISGHMAKNTYLCKYVQVDFIKLNFSAISFQAYLISKIRFTVMAERYDIFCCDEWINLYPWF